MRNGMYVKYKNQEYKAAKINDNYVKLVYFGTNPPNGFKATDYGNYVKKVLISDIDTMYIVKSYVIYNQHEFEAYVGQNDIVTICTSDEKLAEEIGMTEIDRHDYRKELFEGNNFDIIEKIQKID